MPDVKTAAAIDRYSPVNSIAPAWSTNRDAHQLGAASSTTQVGGGLAANTWGLVDMSGNVSEWVWDRYGAFGSTALTDPTGPGNGSNRVRRGGSAWDLAGDVRSASRVSAAPGSISNSGGFRCVRRAP